MSRGEANHRQAVKVSGFREQEVMLGMPPCQASVRSRQPARCGNGQVSATAAACIAFVLPHVSRQQYHLSSAGMPLIQMFASTLDGAIRQSCA